MLSFHNDPKIKEKYVNRVREHQEADRIIQGIGWFGNKGCAVGCTLESYNHSQYPIELGIPAWLAYLEDIIFENLPIEDAKKWPLLFLQTILVGVNLEIVKHKLSILRLDRLIKLQKNLLEKNLNSEEIIFKVINSLEVVKKCHESEVKKKYCDWAAAKSAAWSARSAAYSANSAAWSAANSAAYSAESAGLVGWSAADSAAWSARSAAWAAESSHLAWNQEAEDLIELLRGEK